MATFGEKLKELRAAAGVTQTALASASGVPVGTIRDYEQANRDPSLSAAQKLAHALGKTLDVFDQVLPNQRGRPAPKAKKQKRKEK